MSAQDGLERVRAGLDGHGVQLSWHETDRSWRGRCPVHQGETRTSLSLRHHVPRGSDRGRAQLRCWAGCDERDVLDLIGLTLADLYDDPPPKAPGTVTREHVYLAADTSLVGVVRRTEPKSFRPATLTPIGAWQARSSGDLKRLPYRLPAVVAAVAAGGTVYVPEGENDCDALAAVGVTATCNAGGAGKWTADHAHWLKGADVVVCRDRDDAGRKHADVVVATLQGVAASVRLVEPAEGKDVAEHLAAGRTVADLVPINIRTEPERTVDNAVLVSLSTVEPERLSWLWESRLPAAKIVTMDGDPSVGKSTLGIEIAAHVSTGKPWPDGAPCQLGDVLILSAEDGLADTIRPRLDAAGGDPSRVHAMTAVRTVLDDGSVGERPPTLADIPAITAAIRRTSALIVIVDVMMAFLPGKVDSHKDQDIRAVLSRLSAMTEETRALMLLLRHLNKSGGGSPMYRGGGSIGIVGAARAGYLVARDPDDPETRVLACIKSNLAREPESLTYRLESAPGTDVARIVWTGVSAHDAAGLLRTERDDNDDRHEVDAWLLDLLDQRSGAINAKDVVKAARDAGYSLDQAKRAKKRLGVESVKAGMDGGWEWVSPLEGGTKGAKGVPLGEPPPSLPSAPPSAAEPLCPRCRQPTEHDLILGRCRERCAYTAEQQESA